MVRVLQVIGNMDRGGMESMLMNYYRSMDRKKIQFDFLISNKGKCAYESEIRHLGGRIYKVTPRRNSFLKNRSEMVEFFKKHQYDVIEIHQGVAYLLPLRLAKRYAVRNIIIHNHGVHRKFKKGLLDIFRRRYVIPYIEKNATLFFACSKSVLKDLFSDNIIQEKKYRIVNNAINVENFVYDEEKRIKQRKVLKAGHRTVVGHVGNFTLPKNQEFVVEIAKRMPEFLFVLVGDGEFLNSCKEKASDNVLFYGASDKIDELMQAFDIFILPSLWEGLPLVAIEAQAAGLPVLLSDAVSREAKLTEDVKYVSLTVDDWVDEINKCQNIITKRPREKKDSVVRKSGYDCKVEARKLEKIYEDTAIAALK